MNLPDNYELLKGPSGPFHSEFYCHWTYRWYFETCTPTANGGRPHFIKDNFLGISIQRRKPLKNDKVQFVRIYNGAYGFVILGEDERGLPRFLHKDKVWRYSTYYDGLHSGYFSEEEEAKKFVEEVRYEDCAKL